MRSHHALTRRSPRVAAALAGALLLSSCGGGTTDVPTADLDSSGISIEIHPQLAAAGDDTAPAAAASYVVDATVAKAGDDTEVELQLPDGDSWRVEDTQETDGDGLVSFEVPADVEDFRVVSGDGDDALGVAGSTKDAPKATFTDEFDGKGVSPAWQTRSQGYVGVRTCSRADDSAVAQRDGVLRLSVLDDPKKGDCRYEGKPHAYRLNGHVGTEATQAFTYGYAAARIKFQQLRGQHGAFWLQRSGNVVGGDRNDSGAEIDVMEYFGDEHPQGGLTSFIYYQPKGKKKAKTVGGFIEDSEKYGKDWSSKFHVFSVEWTPEEYVFRVDGRITRRITEGVTGQPEFLVLSLLSSDYELRHIKEDDLPQHMDVDWVRVWAQK